ncbi:MAG: DNA-binding protein WhiA [Clostridia bacterium]|nr:DNA-binding protein WhiA [Clostridia bacterium]
MEMEMTFSEDVKQEILDADMPKNECCRRAMAHGLLACADITEDGSVDIRAASPAQGEQIAAWLRNRMACDISVQDISKATDARVMLHITLRKRADWMARFLDDDFYTQPQLLFPCPHCRAYFIRGAFVAKGTIADPTKSMHLEISCGSDTVAQRLGALLEELGCPPKVVLRSNGQHLYYKNSAAVEDFLTLLNANRALFAVINAKIERELRNNVNRAANCETGNIQKAVVASAKQTAAIRKLYESDRWDTLPEALRQTAQLRLEHPDVSLTELALLHQPVLTKSGLNHRLQKLKALTDELN